MIVEITGANFSNKGAQLMLATVCQRLRQQLPGVSLCLPLRNDAYEDRARYRLHVVIRTPDYRNGWRLYVRDVISSSAVRTKLRKVYGLVSERDVDGAIDVSGYAFGDKWPVSKFERLTRPAAAYRRLSKPVVMLPQMLGPFARPGYSEAFRRLAEQVSLVYARDRKSFDYAEPLVAAGKLRIAPDITILAPAASVPLAGAPYACIVPNSKLLESNPHGPDWRASYVDRLVGACAHLGRRSIGVKVVQHTHGAGDARLVGILSERIGRNACEVLVEPDPQVLKGVLGGAELLIGSRFHSLVSALSMGVPAIALGWAHKYDALMEDFGTPSLIHRADNSPRQLVELIDTVLDDRGTIVSVLTTMKHRLARQIDRMWHEVFQVFGSTQANSTAADSF